LQQIYIELPDIIHLLPDNIANQIAAGEVIQRPASAVKELLENAVDAGAASIQLFVNDAGKSLIQVIDDGKGMSETDARMCFERHATSKIAAIDDLFRIKTMGFRGEALASIAAVAAVELKTKRAEDETGTLIEVENSLVKKQEPVAVPIGTNIAMKNLFFNVPARRNFLKSNAAEMRHIVDEFIRVSLAFPRVLFTLSSNGQQLFHLESGTLKQRIIQILGSNYNSKLVTVQEHTDYMNIYGFVGKPDTAKKTRGDQYFLVNNRFIKSAYLNHAVMNAYSGMIAKDSFPLYVLFIDLDPSQLDINVHPTKQEIKFEDEKIIYAFVQSAVKHALAQFSITPTLEFDIDPFIQQSDAVSKPFTTDKQNAASSSSLFKGFTQKHQAHFVESSQQAELRHWKDFFEAPGGGQQVVSKEEALPFAVGRSETISTANSKPSTEKMELLADTGLLQIHLSYILASTNRGFIVVDQQNAHERVIYERLLKASADTPVAAQRSLFPVTLELSAPDAAMLTELIPDLHQLGYEAEHFGKNSFVIQGTPADVEQGNESRAIELLLEQYKHFSSEIKFSKREKLIRSLAWQQSIKRGKQLTQKEMQGLLDNMFACETPNVTVNGHPTYIEFKEGYLSKIFGK
jgi:DNA mismatch repair protein MutL